jgi:hypothetical protein
MDDKLALELAMTGLANGELSVNESKKIIAFLRSKGFRQVEAATIANPYDPHRPGEPIPVTMLRQGFNEGVKAARG